MVPSQHSRGSSLDGRRALSSSSAGGGSADGAAPEPAQAVHPGAGDGSRSASHVSLASSEGAAAAGQAYAEKNAEGSAAESARGDSSSGQLASHSGADGAAEQPQPQQRSWWFGGGGGKGGADKKRERQSWAARPLLPAPFSQTRAKDDNLRLAVTVCAHSMPLSDRQVNMRLLCDSPAGRPGQ